MTDDKLRIFPRYYRKEPSDSATVSTVFIRFVYFSGIKFTAGTTTSPMTRRISTLLFGELCHHKNAIMAVRLMNPLRE